MKRLQFGAMKRIALFFILCLLCGCSGGGSSKKKLVVTSLPPYAHIAEEIGDDLVDVVSFLSPEDNPHTFEPTPKQMDAIKHASLFIGVGEPYEKKLTAALLQNNPKMQVLDLSPQGVQDRHIWMSPKMMQNQVVQISQAIAHVVPDEALVIKKNTEELEMELKALDQSIGEKLKPFHSQVLLVSHPSFGYFCSEYGFVQVPVESEGKNPLPRQLDVILQMQKTRTFRCAFVVPQGGQKGTYILAKRIEIPVFQFNPLAEDYFRNMQTLANLIAEGKP